MCVCVCVCFERLGAAVDIFICSQSFEGKTSRTEPVYGTSYNVRKVPPTTVPSIRIYGTPASSPY